TGAGAGRTDGAAGAPPAVGTARTVVVAGAALRAGWPPGAARGSARPVRATVAATGDRLRPRRRAVHPHAAPAVARAVPQRADPRSAHRSGALGHGDRAAPRPTRGAQRAHAAGLAEPGGRGLAGRRPRRLPRLRGTAATTRGRVAGRTAQAAGAGCWLRAHAGHATARPARARRRQPAGAGLAAHAN